MRRLPSRSGYVHLPILAPDEGLLKGYRDTCEKAPKGAFEPGRSVFAQSHPGCVRHVRDEAPQACARCCEKTCAQKRRLGLIDGPGMPGEIDSGEVEGLVAEGGTLVGD